jgi:hypothetical protein
MQRVRIPNDPPSAYYPATADPLCEERKGADTSVLLRL